MREMYNKQLKTSISLSLCDILVFSLFEKEEIKSTFFNFIFLLFFYFQEWGLEHNREVLPNSSNKEIWIRQPSMSYTFYCCMYVHQYLVRLFCLPSILVSRTWLLAVWAVKSARRRVRLQVLHTFPQPARPRPCVRLTQGMSDWVCDASALFHAPARFSKSEIATCLPLSLSQLSGSLVRVGPLGLTRVSC